MMITDDLVLYNKMLALRSQSGRPVMFDYQAYFEVEGKQIGIYSVESIETVKDYVTQNSDNILISVNVQTSTRRKLLSVNNRRLKLFLVKNSNNAEGNKTGPTQSDVIEFSAYITNRKNKDIEMNTITQFDYTDDLSGLETLHVHIVNPAIEEFKTQVTGGVFRDANGKGVLLEDILENMFTHTLLNGKKLSATIYPTDNRTVYSQVLVKDSTRIIDLPDHFHHKYGLYANGLGCYLDDTMWHIYPLNKYNRFSEAKRTLTILKIPSKEGVGLHDSYIVEGNNTFVFATGNATYTDETEESFQKKGSGIRYSKEHHILDLWRTYNGGDSHVSFEKNVFHANFDPRDSGLSITNTVDGLFSSNPWYGISVVTEGIGSTIGVTWENANPDLVYPGMPVKYIVKHDNVVKSMYGTLLYANFMVKSLSSSHQDRKYSTTGALLIRCQNLNIDTNDFKM